MTSRVQMDDIQFRLEAIKKELPTGEPKPWKLHELISDCVALRKDDPEGEFAEALSFIEQMLATVAENIASVRELRRQQKRITG